MTEARYSVCVRPETGRLDLQPTRELVLPTSPQILLMIRLQELLRRSVMPQAATPCDAHLRPLHQFGVSELTTQRPQSPRDCSLTLGSAVRVGTGFRAHPLATGDLDGDSFVELMVGSPLRSSPFFTDAGSVIVSRLIVTDLAFGSPVQVWLPTLQ